MNKHNIDNQAVTYHFNFIFNGNEYKFVPMSSGVIKNLKDYEKFSRTYLAFTDVKRYVVGLYKAINGEQMRLCVQVSLKNSVGIETH